MPEPTETGVAGADIEAATQMIREAERIVVLTGAGISTDSGIPDFRGPNGVWTKNPDAERASNIHHYLGDPDLRRRTWRLRLDNPLFGSEPNDGHRAVAALSESGKLALLVTQNVDGLHAKAGSDPDRLVEIHGSVDGAMCTSCAWRGDMEPVLERVRSGEDDPRCSDCGGILKSTTILFGENLVAEDLVRSVDAARSCDLILAVGTSLAVYPAADLVPEAASAGARVVILNAEPTEMDHRADVLLRGSISEILPDLIAEATAYG